MFRKRERVSFIVEGEEITKQSHKEECDINNILSQFKRTGIVRHITSRQALYLDLPSEMDLQTSLAIVKRAEHAFSELPSKVRDRFGNDPGRLLAALGDPTMADELRALGLLKPVRPPDVAEPVPGPIPPG
jgi:phage internal scaffolding protein